MSTEQLIDILKQFHERKPDAKVFNVGIVDDNPDCIRLYWYTDNDGGHIDFLYLRGRYYATINHWSIA